jgi:3-keto-disaccharide hydrolase
MIARTATAALLAVFIVATTAYSQQPPAARGTQPPAGAPAQPGGRGPGRGGPRGPQPLPFESHDGFRSLFDGTTLKGWDGDPKFWRAEGGALVGQTTPENKLTENTFLIWRGGEPADFELKLEFRINATNSGIQIRSEHLPAGTPDGRGGAIAGKWVMKGYQADIDFANQYTGQIYEERGRGFLAMRGQFSQVGADGVPKVLGALQTTDDELKALIKTNDWNQVHLIARGNVITEVLNGHTTNVLVDDDTWGRALKGLIGLQMHVGDPMKVEFRNIWLKQY